MHSHPTGRFLSSSYDEKKKALILSQMISFAVCLSVSFHRILCCFGMTVQEY